MVLFSCTLKGRCRSKKNSKQIFRTKSGRPFITASNEYKKWAIYASMFIRKAKSTECITDPITLHIYAHYANKAHPQDADNVAASICDVLQDCEIIKNDSLVHHLVVKKIYTTQTDMIEIKITPLNV